MKKVGNILLAVGLLMMAFTVFKVYQVYQNQNIGLAKAKSILNDKTLKDIKNFHPKKDDVIGILKIPKLDDDLAIYEGADEDSLEKGVGHHRATAFPGQGEQILLAGHRDTVFRKFGELKPGDVFILEFPYGTFKYKMASSKIVDKNDRTIIRKAGKEELVLSTCYPFHFVGKAPKRYIIYAYPVD
ncbi:class D sortase [Neobacillus sp. SAB-20_R2A]|uniref:class D sortase n=1 Tax=Neobacillus sp. SAB-20_R2A TaxID=3120519 RepID=UPI003C6E18FD